ncbi:MAG TPA: hypothetical protein VFZ61_29240, partial [Polyangiales bacterium]
MRAQALRPLGYRRNESACTEAGVASTATWDLAFETDLHRIGGRSAGRLLQARLVLLEHADASSGAETRCSTSMAVAPSMLSITSAMGTLVCGSCAHESHPRLAFLDDEYHLHLTASDDRELGTVTI